MDKKYSVGIVFIIIVLLIIALLFERAVWTSDLPFWLKFALTK